MMMACYIETHGFVLHGRAGDWWATSSDVEGWGRTRQKAIDAALAERRGQREDAEQMDRDEGVSRDRHGFAVLAPACTCPHGADEDPHGCCRVCGGHAK